MELVSVYPTAGFTELAEYLKRCFAVQNPALICTFKTLQLSVLKCRHSCLLPHTAGPEHQPADGPDFCTYSSAGWAPKKDELGVFPAATREIQDIAPLKFARLAYQVLLQSLANHSSANSHIWMLFHLVLPAVTVIRFQGSLAGKVKWHDMRRIRLKQKFSTLNVKYTRMYSELAPNEKLNFIL